MPKSAPSPTLAQHPVEFREALLTWYRLQQRPLPWRQAPSAYKTVVSEFMLQQTQVKTVLPYFARWMDACPDFATLAALPEERVLKLWEGLGYYSRARNLHKLAKAVTSLPRLPTDTAAWLELPGVGPYTAAAVTSIAFGALAACVDGNVVRILARLTADTTPYRDSTHAAKTHAPLAQSLLSPEYPGDHNQAMMELGATVCVRQNPLCTVCPVIQYCAGIRTGEPDKFPQLQPKKIEQKQVVRAWCLHQGNLLLHRTAAHAKRLANLYELPELAALGMEETAWADTPPIAVKKRGITRFAITETIHRVTSTPLQRKQWALDAALEWVPLGDLDKLTLSGPHRRWATELALTAGPIIRKRKLNDEEAKNEGSEILMGNSGTTGIQQGQPSDRLPGPW